MLWDLLYTSTENDYIDFKQKWYEKTSKGKFDMVHDILAMANSLSDTENRFIFIGVAEHRETEKKTLFDVSQDPNSRKTEEIITILRNYMSVPPRIEVLSERIEDKLISCIKIIPTARDLPYVLNSNLECDEKIVLRNGETKVKKHALIKNAIYSRDSSRNNGNKEYAAKEVVEELFARKKGENLSILDRFALYLDDIKNWKKTTTGSQNTYYYLRNHKFKVVCNTDYDFEKIIRPKKVQDYSYILDFCICEDYWSYHQEGGATYDDHFEWVKVELWSDNTPLEVFDISSIYLKYYLIDKTRIRTLPNDFYLPNFQDLMHLLYDLRGAPEHILKQAISDTLQFKICRMMQTCDTISAKPEMYEKYLDFLNYEDLTDTNYRETRGDFVFAPNIYLKK